MTYGWERAAAKLDRRYMQGETDPVTAMIVNPVSIFSHGQHLIHVPGDVEQIRIQHDERYRGDDVDHAFPSATVKDGKLEIHVEDFVDLILSRLDPVELAQTLWKNDEVKEEFMTCLATRYMGDGLEDKDRRHFLTKVKQAIHSVAVDALVSRVATVEYELAKVWKVWEIQNNINQILREKQVKTWRTGPYDETTGEYPREEVVLQFDLQNGYGQEFGIGGKAYHEAQSHWRKEIEARFLGPEAEAEEPSAHEIDEGSIP